MRARFALDEIINFARIKDFFERETVASIVTEYDRDPGSNYADEQLKQKVKSRASSKQVKGVICSQVWVIRSL